MIFQQKVNQIASPPYPLLRRISRRSRYNGDRHQYRYHHFRGVSNEPPSDNKARAPINRAPGAHVFQARRRRKERARIKEKEDRVHRAFSVSLPPPSCRPLRTFILRYRAADPFPARMGKNSDVCPAPIFIRSGALTKHNQLDYLAFYLPIVYSTRNSRGERGRVTQTYRERERENGV